MTTPPDGYEADLASRKQRDRALKAARIQAATAGSAKERKRARATVRAVWASAPTSETWVREAQAELKTPEAKAAKRAFKASASAASTDAAQPSGAAAKKVAGKRTAAKKAPAKTAPVVKSTAAKNTAAATAPAGGGKAAPAAKKAVAKKTAAAKPPAPPPPSPGAVRLSKAVAAVRREQEAATKKTAGAAKKTAPAALPGAGGAVKKAPAKKTAPRPVQRPSTATSVRKIRKHLAAARRRPHVAAGTVLLYALVGSIRLGGAGLRRLRRRGRLTWAALARRRSAARLQRVASRHAGCAYCRGTGVITVYDADHHFAGSRPCRRR